MFRFNQQKELIKSIQIYEFNSMSFAKVEPHYHTSHQHSSSRFQNRFYCFPEFHLDQFVIVNYLCRLRKHFLTV